MRVSGFTLAPVLWASMQPRGRSDDSGLHPSHRESAAQLVRNGRRGPGSPAPPDPGGSAARRAGDASRSPHRRPAGATYQGCRGRGRAPRVNAAALTRCAPTRSLGSDSNVLLGTALGCQRLDRRLPARQSRQRLHHDPTRPRWRAPTGAGQRGRPFDRRGCVGDQHRRLKRGRADLAAGIGGHRRAASGGRRDQPGEFGERRHQGTPLPANASGWPGRERPRPSGPPGRSRADRASRAASPTNRTSLGATPIAAVQARSCASLGIVRPPAVDHLCELG